MKKRTMDTAWRKLNGWKVDTAVDGRPTKRDWAFQPQLMAAEPVRFIPNPKPKVTKTDRPIKVGDHVMFNPKREGYPTAIDGVVVKLKRFFGECRMVIEPMPDCAHGVAMWRIVSPRVAVTRIPKRRVKRCKRRK